ncbi:MAG: mechanosensitive ion channel family protein [Acidimicrobiia bacterium]|nr:mechanosensitive ion channel family protein [Acidimicrobiia bacterium]
MQMFQTQTDDPLAQLGGLTAADWIVAGSLLVGAGVLAMLVRRLLSRLMSAQLPPFLVRLLSRVAAGLVFGFGLIYALGQVGVSLAPLLGIAGLFGLAFALAFQDVLANFVAGVFLAARRPFDQGDEIVTGDLAGVVEDIQLRALTLRTYDGQRVYVPNSMVWSNPIINRTELGRTRTRLEIGVAYGTQLDLAHDVLLRALGAVEGVLDDPAPQARAHEFGDSSINFALLFWHAAPKAQEWRVRHEVAVGVKAALDEAGITIPFPQRVVKILGAAAD